ncbi:MAG: hypothetical protein A2629_01945 [Candidatus Levybacteria bacterium RIFCSPHIGHO2_01_FULL_41_15]|nr:MAG: hypothetical protein A2629_01945 [Candidatus Levybacteria bacterium RIFCSPHIGHO2_01_FULL_41_15]
MSELPHAGPSLSSREDGSNGFELRTYKPEEAARIYQELEVPNWAPWLRASPETLAKRAVVFPEGQIAIWKGKRPIASISLNRFNYDGNPDNLPTWDELAGYPSTYEETYDPNGNAVAMMSINIHPEFQGQGLTGDIITAVKTLRETLGIKHIMGSFRPSQFGDYSHDNPRANFTTYSHLKRPDRLPQDAWLRALTRNGMDVLRVDDFAMMVPDVSMEEFEEYRRTYFPEKWRKMRPDVWRCGQTGIWVVGRNGATYLEGNVWGILEDK